VDTGAGTGYNAALLAQLTGPAGHVTTIELDAIIAAEAGGALAAAGYSCVTVIAGDGGTATLRTRPTTESSSPLARGNCRVPGLTSSPLAGSWSSRCGCGA
jgi:predicted O-methyltransferase YrrM